MKHSHYSYYSLGKQTSILGMTDMVCVTLDTYDGYLRSSEILGLFPTTLEALNYIEWRRHAGLSGTHC